MVGAAVAGGDGSRAMTTMRYLNLAIAIVLGGIFIYAGADKIRDPSQFADSVAAFQMLPYALVTPMALGLPIFEVLAGVLLLAPLTRRIGALAVVLLTAMFLVALISALARGLTLDCGCFGAGAPSRPRMFTESGLDVLLFASSWFLYGRQRESR